MFYYLLKFQSNTLLINYFIIKYKLHGMVIRRSRRWVSWRSTKSLFSMLLYILYYTFKHSLFNWKLNWLKWQNVFKIVGSTEQFSQITRAKWNKNQIKSYQYQRPFLLMTYDEKTSYFKVAPLGHTIPYKYIDNLLKNVKFMSSFVI